MNKRARGNGGVFRVKGSRFWWISYQLNGEGVRESSGELTKTAAGIKLKNRLLTISAGNFMGPQIEKITVDELYADLLQDYRINSQDVGWAERLWNVHLKGFFSGMKAAHVGTTQITSYIVKRMSEPKRPAVATVNRELALLRRAFTIAFESEPQKVIRIPKFHKHIVSEKGNERRGFVEEQQYRKLADAAAGKLWLRALLALGYAYGFRRSELLDMRCHQVDLLNNTVCLYAGETKSGEPRIAPLTEECRALVVALRAGKHPDDHLITRDNGEPVKEFSGAWEMLIAAAGVPGLLFHDLRRSAIRNMVRRGIPQKTAMLISGHKTDAVFSRYNIVDEEDIRDAVRKIEEGSAAAQSQFIVDTQSGGDEEAKTAIKPM